MARPLRIEFNGAFYHVISRGNDKKNIFETEADRRKFLKYLKVIIQRYRVKIHGYCLMDNHYHIILETPEGNLCKAMHNLNSSYTAYFNAKHQRSGHLFQGRYKAILVQADEYAHQVSAYIHLNPARAGLVKRPADYPWSSYKYYINPNHSSKMLSVEFILSLFDKDIVKARQLYQKFVEKALVDHAKQIKEGLTAGLVLAKPEFVSWVKSNFLGQKAAEEIPQLKQLMKSPITMERIANVVEQVVSEKKLARKLSIYLSRKFTDKKLLQIADFHKNISYAGISKMCARIDEERITNNKLNKLILSAVSLLNVKTPILTILTVLSVLSNLMSKSCN